MPLLQEHYDHLAKLRDWFIRYYHYEMEAEDLEYELQDTSHHWSGTMFCCGDIFVGMDSFETIMKDNIHCDIFHTWYWWNCENNQDKKQTVNLENYARMRKEMTHGEVIAHIEEQERIRKTPEHKAKVKSELKKIVEAGRKELEKYINNHK